MDNYKHVLHSELLYRLVQREHEVVEKLDLWWYIEPFISLYDFEEAKVGEKTQREKCT